MFSHLMSRPRLDALGFYDAVLGSVGIPPASRREGRLLSFAEGPPSEAITCSGTRQRVGIGFTVAIRRVGACMRLASPTAGHCEDPRACASGLGRCISTADRRNSFAPSRMG